MSEIGVLSHRYDRSAHFSEELNNSVLTIKMVYYNIHGIEDIGQEKLNKSKEELIEIISEIMENLDPEKTRIDLEKHFISRNLINNLYNMKKGRLKFYLDDLKNAINHLKNISKITEDDIKILDELCSLGNTESSMIFRKLWLE